MVFGSKKQQTRTATKKATRGQQKQNNCDDGLVTKKTKTKNYQKNRVPSFPPAYQQNCNDLAQYYFFKA